MSSDETWAGALTALHVGGTVAWLLLAAHAATMRAPSPPNARLQAVAAALLAALALPLAGATGWWVDLPSSKVVPHLAAGAAVLTLAGAQRLPGRLAALALGGFFLALGAAALRNATPLPPWAATKALLLGLALVLLCWRHRAAAGATVLILLAGAGLGLLRDIPLP